MAAPVFVRRVEKHFPTDAGMLTALHHIDFGIAAGEFVAIVGPSGCGKSTLLRLIGGLDMPSSGEIWLGDRPVTAVDPRCAVVFQEPRLFPWKRVAANVAVGSRRLGSRPAPEQWLEQVGLAGFERSYPHQLSGGMAQRVALARALIGTPQVLLLDEPFAALDALTRLRMQELLAQVCTTSGATTVMVTHDIDEALYLADRVVVMSERPGRIIDILHVNRPRPRERGDQALAALRSRVLCHLGFATCTGSAAETTSAAAD